MQHESMMRQGVVAVPGIGGALLAKLACPVCWPTYAGLLGSLGLGAAEYTSVGLPLGVGFLFLALGSLAYRASARRGYGPLVLGLLGASAVLLGELALSSEPLALSGIGLLIGASVWNAWPRRAQATPDRGATCARPDVRDRPATSALI